MCRYGARLEFCKSRLLLPRLGGRQLALRRQEQLLLPFQGDRGCSLVPCRPMQRSELCPLDDLFALEYAGQDIIYCSRQSVSKQGKSRKHIPWSCLRTLGQADLSVTGNSASSAENATSAAAPSLYRSLPAFFADWIISNCLTEYLSGLALSTLKKHQRATTCVETAWPPHRQPQKATACTLSDSCS